MITGTEIVMAEEELSPEGEQLPPSAPPRGERRAFSTLAYVWRRTRDPETGAA
jgi:hypothetical protein